MALLITRLAVDWTQNEPLNKEAQNSIELFTGSNLGLVISILLQR